MTETPLQYARELWEIWSHLDETDRWEQVEAHMESAGFSYYDIESVQHKLY